MICNAQEGPLSCVGTVTLCSPMAQQQARGGDSCVTVQPLGLGQEAGGRGRTQGRIGGLLFSPEWVGEAASPRWGYLSTPSEALWGQLWACPSCWKQWPH